MSLKFFAKATEQETRVEFDGKVIYASKGSVEETIDLSPVMPLVIYAKSVWEQAKILFPQLQSKPANLGTDAEAATKEVADLEKRLATAKEKAAKFEGNIKKA